MEENSNNELRLDKWERYVLSLLASMIASIATTWAVKDETDFVLYALMVGSGALLLWLFLAEKRKSKEKK
ncbi:MAG: hypothetical protein ACTTH5_04165 [Wolinella sp.]